jgi:hypothetical protein
VTSYQETFEQLEAKGEEVRQLQDALLVALGHLKQMTLRSAKAISLRAEVDALRAERDALRTDAALLDALQAEHERFDPVAALVVKVKHDRNSSDWANVVGDVRAALNAALSALAVQP